MLWSTLLKRVFEVDGLACPLCDQPMRLRAVVLPQREPAEGRGRSKRAAEQAAAAALLAREGVSADV